MQFVKKNLVFINHPLLDMKEILKIISVCLCLSKHKTAHNSHEHSKTLKHTGCLKKMRRCFWLGSF